MTSTKVMACERQLNDLDKQELVWKINLLRHVAESYSESPVTDPCPSCHNFQPLLRRLKYQILEDDQFSPSMELLLSYSNKKMSLKQLEQTLDSMFCDMKTLERTLFDRTIIHVAVMTGMPPSVIQLIQTAFKDINQVEDIFGCTADDYVSIFQGTEKTLCEDSFDSPSKLAYAFYVLCDNLKCSFCKLSLNIGGIISTTLSSHMNL